MDIHPRQGQQHKVCLPTIIARVSQHRAQNVRALCLNMKLGLGRTDGDDFVDETAADAGHSTETIVSLVERQRGLRASSPGRNYREEGISALAVSSSK